MRNTLLCLFIVSFSFTWATAHATAEQITPSQWRFPGSEKIKRDDPSRLVNEEILRRQDALIKSRALLDEGKRSYFAGNYQDAIQKLEQALKILPRAKSTKLDHKRIIHALTDSYYRLANDAYQAGDSTNARSFVETALKHDPKNRSARSLLKRLNRGTASTRRGSRSKTSTQLSPELSAKEQQIQKLQDEGVALLDSGQYDEAELRFHQALQLDKYNEDTHYLLGEVNAARQLTSQIAADEARKGRLWEVTKSWVPPVNQQVSLPKDTDSTGPIGASGIQQAEMLKKLNSIIIPEINLRDAVITDVINFLSEESRRVDPDKTGVNIVLQLGDSPGAYPPPIDDPVNYAPPSSLALAGIHPITLSMRNIPLIEAIKYVTQAAGLKFRVEPSAILVLPKDAPEGELITRSYPVASGAIKTIVEAPSEDEYSGGDDYRGLGGGVKTAQIADVKQFFIDAGVPFPAGSSLAYNDRTSTIIVRNTPENLEVFERILATLNVVPSQVEIEAKFVEISQNDLDELGFKWSLGQKQFGDFLGEGGSPRGVNPGSIDTDLDDLTRGLRDSTSIKASAVDALLAGASGNQLNNLGLIPGGGNEVATIRGILTNPQFELIIKALSQKQSADVLSAPKITTISGSQAQIKVVQEFIYPSEYSLPQVGDNVVSPSIPETFKTRETGVLLNVTPTVGADGYTINLTLIPEVSEFQGFIDYSPGPTENIIPAAAGSTAPPTIRTVNNIVLQPLFSTRSLTTSIVIWDGQTVVLGGLIREDLQKVVDKIPLLGDIPYLGRLFQSKTTVRSKRNLLVFVTARLVDPAGNPIHKEETASLK